MAEDHSGHKERDQNRILEDVRESGYHIAYLEGNEYLPGYVYSIGLFKTFNHPEIIVFGLNREVMATIVQYIGNQVREGFEFKKNIDYDEIISNFPVKFIEVDKDYYPDYLGYGGWFYNMSFDFPTYQLVWTDKNSKYPWDENFNGDWKFKQPILDRDIDFKFYEERNLAVYTTEATIEGKPVLRVYHNENGDWQFHSEELPEINNSKLVCLENLVKTDPTLNEVYYLSYGQYATRADLTSEWEIFDEEE